MKVLLTGAGGSIGYETLRQIVNTNHDVTVLDLDNRKNRRRFKKFEDKIKVIYGSVNDEELISKIVPQQDAIIHLAAIIPPLADKRPDLTLTVNFYGTQTIIKTIMKLDKKPFLIFSSSVSVYGDRLKNYWIKVGDALNPSEGDYYAKTKIATEEMIISSNVPYVIFRLTGIMGHPATDPLMFHMPLDTKLEIASVEDTAYAFIKALEHTEELNGKIFNLSGGKRCRTTYREFIATMFKIYGINVSYLKDVSFAEHNFHCGYFKDADKLNDILSFQQDTLESYYNRVKTKTRGIVRFFSKLFSRPIVFFLMRKSEPLRAKKSNDKKLIKRFFNKEDK